MINPLFCVSISRRIFPRELFPEHEKIDEAHYTFRIRDRLRKHVLVPLRSASKLPELYMSSNNWSMLPYNLAPYVAMKKYWKTFMKHDKKVQVLSSKEYKTRRKEAC
ncbi:hypothetical protein MKX01_024627 [Papaver californicum]|nr:hypothetical protein MKX01_024627 [Papaver californicum]